MWPQKINNVKSHKNDPHAFHSQMKYESATKKALATTFQQ